MTQKEHRLLVFLMPVMKLPASRILLFKVSESIYSRFVGERNCSTAMIVAVLIEHKPLREMSFAYRILSPFLWTVKVENAPCIKRVELPWSLVPEKQVVIKQAKLVDLSNNVKDKRKTLVHEEETYN